MERPHDMAASTVMWASFFSHVKQAGFNIGSGLTKLAPPKPIPAGRSGWALRTRVTGQQMPGSSLATKVDSPGAPGLGRSGSATATPTPLPVRA